VKYGWVDAHRRQYERVALCDALGASACSYRTWRYDPKSWMGRWRGGVSFRVNQPRRRPRPVEGDATHVEDSR
jgi:hypothetical protein